MNDSEKNLVMEAILDIIQSLKKLARAVEVRESLIDALYKVGEKKNEDAEKIEKAIDKVNEKEKEIDRLAKFIISSEIQFKEKDKEKIKTLLKMIAICKIAGIGEYSFSKIVKNNEELLNKIGYIGINNIYHAIKYTGVWKYRNEVYKMFRLKMDKVEVVKCPYCGSTDVIKQGRRKTKHGYKQRYYCKSCNKSFVLHRDKNVVLYNKKWKDIAGRLYCDLERNLLLKDVADIMRNEYGLNVSSATVSNWINDFIYENLSRLTQAQKNMLVAKKIVELNGRDANEIVDLIKKKWNYRVTHVKMFELVASYKKIKKHEDEIINLLKEGKDFFVISKIFDINKDILEVMYGKKQ